MRTLTGLMGAALLAGATACTDRSAHGSSEPEAITVGSGRFVTETRPVSGFNSIDVSSAGSVTVTRGEVESVEVTAEDNILPLVETHVVNDRLMLRMIAGAGSLTSHGVTYRIIAREVREIVGSGASRIDLPGLAAAQLLVHLSGASTLTASGSVDRLDVTLSGASRCRLSELDTRVVVATLTGASVGLVHADESLFVTASGASMLEYLGNPVVQVQTSSDSIVRRVAGS
jgi:putative autotransporter adhesin-like protein